jgi:hypothetical protein
LQIEGNKKDLTPSRTDATDQLQDLLLDIATPKSSPCFVRRQLRRIFVFPCWSNRLPLHQINQASDTERSKLSNTPASDSMRDQARTMAPSTRDERKNQ